MTQHYRLVLPVGGSVNRMYRATCRGGYAQLYKAPAVKEYQDVVRLIAMSEGVTPLEGDIELHLVWFRRRPKKNAGRRGDLDNRLKVVIDALQGLAYTDDKQVTLMSAQQRYLDTVDEGNEPYFVLLVAPYGGLVANALEGLC